MTAPTPETAETAATSEDVHAGTPPADGGQQTAPAPDPTADVDSADASTEDGHPAADAEHQDDVDEDGGKAGRDAAKYRARLRETEAERDALRDQLAAQRRAMIDWRAQNGPASALKFDPALMDANGIDVDALLDDETGQLDMGKVDQFIEATGNRFIVSRGFTPNRGQGQSGGQPAHKPGLADAFRQN